MQYILMNRNSLEGFLKGYFRNLQPMFYLDVELDEERDVPRYLFTDVLGDACRFASEAQAWAFAREVWGIKFANTNFLVVSARKDALDRSSDSREIIQKARNSNG